MIPDNREAETPAAPPERLIYPVDETARLLGGITDRKLRSMVSAGELIPTRVGRRVFFSRSEIERYIAAREAEEYAKVAA